MMMKIGILTWFFGMNYGAQAQLYAMTHFLESQGHEVCIIAFYAPKYRITNLKMTLNIERDWYLHPRQLYYSIRRMFRFHKWIKRLPLTRIINNPIDIDGLSLDAIIIGSDELINCRHPLHTSIYFSEGITQTPIIYYAPSSGALDVQYQLASSSKTALQNICCVSGRDSYTCAFLKNNGCTNVECVVDPTMLYHFKELKVTFPIQDYILLYSFEPLDKYKKEICEYAECHSLKILSVGRFYKWANCSLPYATETEWISSFCNASLVITDSFHGLIFAIKNNKDFVLLGRTDKLNKNNDILEKLHITKTYYTQKESLDEYLHKYPINYSNVDEMLEKEIEHSKNYLLRSLQKVCT